MQSATWYWNRLKSMSAPEIAHRVRQHAVAWAQKNHGWFVASAVPEPTDRTGGWATSPSTADFDVEPYTREADRVVAGTWDVFSLKDAELGCPPRWNRDPRSGTEAPLSFGKTMDYRDERLVGDIKYLWEPNRHLQLATLAQAYFLTRDNKYLRTFRQLLGSWFEQCPYLRGPNWSSSLELAIRLINWSLCWQWLQPGRDELFGDEEGQEFERRWLTSIYQHCHFISGHFSRYSSANNHLIGEAAGLVVASATWPRWRDSDLWMNTGRSILESEVRQQNTADGVNREQAVAYQQFVLDFLILAGIAAKAVNQDFSAEYWQRVEKMLEFVTSIMDVQGNVPMFGDADDGFVVSLSREPGFCPFRSLLATGGVLLGRPDLLLKAGRTDDKTRWLLAQAVNDEPVADAPDTPRREVSRSFPEGGYYVLGEQLDSQDEIRIVADAGPLGYQSIAAHGHADALSFVMSVGGHEFLIDPGTYSYHTKKFWRNYFRGTAAHNTVRVDGFDQSEISGNFMWSHHARSECLKWAVGENRDEFVGRHDGYQRLSDPVLPQRSLTLDKGERTLTVTDTIECGADHVVERWWHFSEDCVVRKSDSGITAVNNGIEVNLITEDTSAEISLLEGDENAPAGWVSRSFDSKVPTSSVRVTSRVRGNTELKTTIRTRAIPRTQDVHR